MDEEILADLNEIMSTEYTSMIQLMQHSFLMQGADRYTFAKVLRGHAKDTLTHARELGDKIVSMGGIPSVQVGEIQQSADTEEMLRQDLEQHRKAVAKIDETVGKADARKMVALRVLLENMSYEETAFAEELEKALRLKSMSSEELARTPARRSRVG